MSEPIQTIAKSMEVGGASVAVTPWVMNALGWLDDHSQAAMVLIGILGVVISFCGLLLHTAIIWYFKSREDRRQQEAHESLLKRGEGRHFRMEDE